MRTCELLDQAWHGDVRSKNKITGFWDLSRIVESTVFLYIEQAYNLEIN